MNIILSAEGCGILSLCPDSYLALYAADEQESQEIASIAKQHSASTEAMLSTLFNQKIGIGGIDELMKSIRSQVKAWKVEYILNSWGIKM